MSSDTTSQDFFEQKYQRDPDPWDFAGSAYEQSRYAAILSALHQQQYRRGFEPGCSVGVLTASLSPFCQELHAIDISPTAVSRAQERCKRLTNVTICSGALPAAIPAGNFDLIVFSEIGYYFERQQLKELVQILATTLNCGGVLIAAHWLGKSQDHLLSGDEVHEVLRGNEKLSLDEEQRFPLFRLDRLVRQ
jgi:SAM-dependent methyltransferase